jgi:hypothetical protein
LELKSNRFFDQKSLNDNYENAPEDDLKDDIILTPVDEPIKSAILITQNYTNTVDNYETDEQKIKRLKVEFCDKRKLKYMEKREQEKIVKFLIFKKAVSPISLRANFDHDEQQETNQFRFVFLARVLTLVVLLNIWRNFYGKRFFHEHFLNYFPSISEGDKTSFRGWSSQNEDLETNFPNFIFMPFL